MEGKPQDLAQAHGGADTTLADVEKAPPAREQSSSQNTSDGDATNKSAFKALGLLDRFLAVWILLAMIIGVLLGNFVPETGPALDKGKFVGVSVPIGENSPCSYSYSTQTNSVVTAVGLLVMMYPILCKVRYESLLEIVKHPGLWKQILFSVIVNWIVAPFLMVSLANLRQAIMMNFVDTFHSLPSLGPSFQTRLIFVLVLSSWA
jgi:ACR3 family arsenite transporter